MKEHFYEGTKVSREDILPLLIKQNQPAIFRFVVMYALFLGSTTGIVLSWSLSWWIPALFILAFGILSCSLFACEHETIHQTAFNSKNWNRAAALLCGIGHLYPPTAFQELHFTHHRYTHVPGKDPEISLGHRAIPSVVNSLPTYLVWLMGLPLLIFKVMMLIFGMLGMPNFARKAIYPFIRPSKRLPLAAESLLIFGIHASITLLAIFVHPGFWGLWIGQLLGHSLLASYLVMEHNGLPHQGSIMEKTRSIKTPKWVKILMWNMPYHAEHHAYPAIPFYALPRLHQQLEDEIIHKKESHPGFHFKVLTGKFWQSNKPPS